MEYFATGSYTGVRGDPSKASAAKGEVALEAAADEVAAIVDELRARDHLAARPSRGRRQDSCSPRRRRWRALEARPRAMRQWYRRSRHQIEVPPRGRGPTPPPPPPRGPPTPGGGLLAALALSTIGGVGLWSVVVALPAIQAEFGVDRGGASLPYTATMLGFAVGGVLMGRLADRFGIVVPAVLGALMLGLGYIAAAQRERALAVRAAQALLIGMLGSSATFGPLVADVSLWFVRRRGIAVAIVASGNYLAGTLWPPLLQHAIDAVGWRQAHLGIGALVPRHHAAARAGCCAGGRRSRTPRAAGARDHRRHACGCRRRAAGLLVVAGLACCIAMSMPQVHIVAYCADLGYGPARGAEMLSLMLGFGVVSRLASGLIADRIGGVGTLILGSALQCLALCSTCRSTGWPRSTWSRRCSGCRRAASCRATR